jgi:spermidine synthase
MLALIAALALSGAAGLTYQVLWFRLLSLSFGVTAYAASTVLAGFMAGLAVGSILAGRVAGRVRRPLRLFAMAEVAIAVTALGTLAALTYLPIVSAATHRVTGDSFGLLTLVRFLTAFLVLVVPTTFMGATLPLVAASRLVHEGATAARVSAAYASNTAGAIAGVLLTGYVLVGTIGIRASFFVAAAFNVAAALLAWVVSRKTEQEPAVRPTGDHEARQKPRLANSRRPGVRAAVLVVLAVSGLASLALEVVWFRILVQFITATTYAFTTMLASVLGGIAAGGWIAARMLRTERDWLRTFLHLQAATAIAIVASLVALSWTYAAGWRTSGLTQACALTILPAALLMGMSFPIGLRLWSLGAREGGPDNLAHDVGVAYAANVCGAIAGAILGGFVLLPLLGSRASLVSCAAIYLVCAAVLAWVSLDRGSALRRTAILAVGFSAIALLVPDPFLTTLERRHGQDEQILWRDEGIQTTVSVHTTAEGGHVLYLDGLHQASETPEILALHRQIGHLPMMLHGNARKALVIGLGGGATAGAVSQHPSAAVDVVELSDSVRNGAVFFADVSYDVLRQPNVRLRVDDGRNFLLTTDQKYDVITADIIQPIHAGAGLLYSREYFALAERALADGGLMLQWIGHRPETQYKLIARSFLDVFPHATAWLGGTMLIGSTRPLAISRAAFDRERTNETTRRALDAIGLHSFETLLSWYAAGPEALRALVGEGEVLSDDRPRIEYHRSLPPESGTFALSGLLRDVGEIRVEP